MSLDWLYRFWERRQGQKKKFWGDWDRVVQLLGWSRGPMPGRGGPEIQKETRSVGRGLGGAS